MKTYPNMCKRSTIKKAQQEIINVAAPQPQVKTKKTKKKNGKR